MTHTLKLDSQVEQVLVDKARRRGLALDAYLLELARRDAAQPDSIIEYSSGDPLFVELDELALQFPINAPPLADDAVARLYSERETAES